ncbi:hypothetical protein [Streptomyces sp. KR80]|uniref:hypothetical protein n=1 Tax=Streptomyces sp. KR80 TaxID=3457426 RepID=UPI003FD393AB
MVRTPIPHDLVQIQRAWHGTYRALAESPSNSAALRRRLQVLSSRIASHPFWKSAPPAVRVELRRQARAHDVADTP